MKKRLFAGALALLMIIGLLPVSSMLKKPVEAQAAQSTTYTLSADVDGALSTDNNPVKNFFTVSKINTTSKRLGNYTTAYSINDSDKTITFTIPNGAAAKVTAKWTTSNIGVGLKISDTLIETANKKNVLIESVFNVESGTYTLERIGSKTAYLFSFEVTVTDPGYTITVNDEHADSATVTALYAEGSTLNLSAKGTGLLYWKNSNGVIVATGDKGIPVYYSDTYTAVYAKTGAKVEYLTPYGGVLKTYYAEDVKNADFKVPQGPTRYGYTFDGWDTDVNADNIDTLLAYGDVTVKPKYKDADSNIKITVDTTDFDSIKRESSNITINTEIKASVSSDEFAYWAEVDDTGKILNVLSYNSTYYFLANREIIVKAITKSAAGDNANAKPIITKVDYVTDTTGKTVIYEYTVPKGYTMNFVGVLASTNKTNLESATVDSNVAGVYKLGASDEECSAYETFRYTLTITGTDTWYIKPILTYSGTSAGTEYGEVLTIN